MDGDDGFVEAKGGGLGDDDDAPVLDPDFRVSFDQAVDIYWGCGWGIHSTSR